MKAFVQRAKEIGGAMADAVRRAVDPPLDDDARPLDVKRAILEAVEQQVEPAGGGRRLLPGEVVHVRILAVNDEVRPSLDAVLADLQQALITRLRELRCDIPRRLGVDVAYVPAPLADWASDQRLQVTVDNVAARGVTQVPTVVEVPQPSQRSAVPALTITVVRGEAVERTATFRESVIRIGRSADPTDERGRPRFNHVAFLENDSPENRTVTRGHAVIRFNAETGEFRLFDEGSANGTRVLRSGDVIDLPKRDPIGFTLRSEDEVQLGKAAIRVTFA